MLLCSCFFLAAVDFLQGFPASIREKEYLVYSIFVFSTSAGKKLLIDLHCFFVHALAILPCLRYCTAGRTVPFTVPVHYCFYPIGKIGDVLLPVDEYFLYDITISIAVIFSSIIFHLRVCLMLNMISHKKNKDLVKLSIPGMSERRD
jgi:hypothetical protein